ncbi:UNVERIFIED_ORG: outer membrane usher protein FimD/PapC [Providencia alcalifaciens]
MVWSPQKKFISLKFMGLYISLMLGMTVTTVYAIDDIQFNTDILDVYDRKNIDLTQFSKGGYIMPGTYNMVVYVNKNELAEQKVEFISLKKEENESRACINKELVEQLGLKENILKDLTWWNQGKCLDENSLNGMIAKGDLSTYSLYLNIPQAFMEYTDENWVPPSNWEEGISGILLDYNINARGKKELKKGKRSYNLSGNGTAGINLGAWRMRTDWQANFDHEVGSDRGTRKEFNWTRYYAYRALPTILSKLILGEIYLDTNMFDSFRFTGASIISDDNMLPFNLRGYAPEVIGIAKTNAKVIISQQGRTLYETTVAAGPFRIQELSDAVTGELNVRVEEQDGHVQEFSVNTANIPFLTRPGSVRFKMSAGKPSDWKHHLKGPIFATGEFSWGVSNGWSLYGGGLTGGNYNALSIGIGRDLLAFGALSFDITQSWAKLPQEEVLRGGSYRLSYSKRFDKYDSQVTFAGYRFSEENFMSMSEYLDARYYGDQNRGKGKEQYTISFNKNFSDLNLSTYIDYSHETYWDKPSNDRYSLTLSRYFNVGKLNNLALSLSAYRNKYNGIKDDGAYLSLSIPWGNDASVSYNATANRDDTTHRVSYHKRINAYDNYQLSVGESRSGVNLSSYYNHTADAANMSVNASYQEGRYSALGMSMQGAMTATMEGGALHRGGLSGGTRILVDTNGIPNVPVRGYGKTVNSNSWGKAVITDLNSYQRNKISIDLDALNDEAEAIKSVVQSTLTEGAIGYRSFELIGGSKAMIIIKLPDGKEPPFGATVMNMRKQSVGIVNDGGNAYLSGLKPDEKMVVYWDGIAQCEISMPSVLPKGLLTDTLLLPCKLLN